MSKHTPGPWNIVDLPSDYDAIISSMVTDQGIAHIYNAKPGNPYFEDEAAANARLIAKAPEMYEVLKEYVRMDAGHEDSLSASARALLAEIDGAADA